MIEWHQQNPVHDNVDIEFLMKEIVRLRKVLVSAQQQQEPCYDLAVAASTNTPPSNVGRRWRGIVPYLCVIMCLMQDQAKTLFLTRADVQT